MSDIKKQARDKLKSAAAKAADNFDPNMFVETRDVLALLDELEESERLRLKFQEANCELCQKLEAADKRIAELEAREVNLPQRQEPTSSGHYGEGYLVPSDTGSALDYEETVDALVAAGIITKVER